MELSWGLIGNFILLNNIYFYLKCTYFLRK